MFCSHELNEESQTDEQRLIKIHVIINYHCWFTRLTSVVILILSLLIVV